MTNYCTPIPILHVATLSKLGKSMGTNSAESLKQLKRPTQHNPSNTHRMCTARAPCLILPLSVALLTNSSTYCAPGEQLNGGASELVLVAVLSPVAAC